MKTATITATQENKRSFKIEVDADGLTLATAGSMRQADEIVKRYSEDLERNGYDVTVKWVF